MVISTLSMISTVVLTGLTSGMMVLLWLKLIVIILPPYMFAGMAISLALTRSPWPVGIVYGVDLLGAASGCLVVLALLTWMDGVSALIAVGAIGAVAAACFRAAWRASRDPRMPRAFGQPLVRAAASRRCSSRSDRVAAWSTARSSRAGSRPCS